MHFEEDFVVRRPFDELARELVRDETIEALFPDTRIDHRPDGTLETRTPYSGSRDIRFIVLAEDSGRVSFSKVCDGNVWRELQGEVRLEELDERACRVTLELFGTTRGLVPEIAIRMPMRDQIAQMTKNLRAALS